MAYPAGRTAAYTVPENVRYIGSCAFAYTKASSVDLGSVTEIGGSAFAASSLSAVVIPDTVISMGQYAFQSSAYLSSVKIGSGLRDISKEAFEYCSNLSEITIPAGIESIGDYAFADTAIAGSVTIPASLESLGGGVFGACHALTEIKVESGNKAYTDIDGVVYTKDGKVNAIDLTILRRYLARYSSEIDISVADFNGDGKVNTLDLMLLRRFLVGYDSVLGK